jgi:hypothetical protein
MLTSKKDLFADYGVSKPQKSVDPKTRRLQLEKEFFEAADNLRRKTEALLEIKRDKLYLQVSETWEEYCAQIFGQSVEAVRLQFRALDIEDELKNPHNVVTPPLSEKDLSPVSKKLARLPGSAEVIVSAAKEVLKDNPKASAVEIESAIKARRLPEKVKGIKVNMTTPEDEAAELFANVIKRIGNNRKNLKFLQALDEWLEESGL